MLYPIRLTAAATRKLPRTVLWALLLLYALPGLFGRDPWTGEDGAGFGVMWTMAQGSLADWLVPNVLGLPLLDDGPAAFWVGALFIQVFGPVLGADEAARLGMLALFMAGAAGIWYATYLLSRRADVQPQPLAFGGQPAARDYGRAIADTALLLALATLGLLVRSHETVAEPTLWAASAGALFGLVRALDKPIQGALWLGLSVVVLTLSHGLGSGFYPLIALLFVVLMSPVWRVLSGYFWLTLMVSVVASLLAWYGITHTVAGGQQYLAQWLSAQQPQAWLLEVKTWLYYLRNAAWFWWPVWPMALWAGWSWRYHRAATPFTLATAFLLAGVLHAAFVAEASQTPLLLMTPALLLLAAFGLPALKRGAAHLIDWFALFGFSVFALLIWLGWLATASGWPSSMANNFFKLAPGFRFEFNGFYFVIALLVSAAWLWLVRWRVRSRSGVLWRGAVLSSAGVTLVWGLVMTLHFPYVDYLKSYRIFAAQLKQQLPAQACLQAGNLGAAERASLAYLAAIRFGQRCNYLLYYQARGAAVPLNETQWQAVWNGRRPADRRSRFMLYQRINAIENPRKTVRF